MFSIRSPLYPFEEGTYQTLRNSEIRDNKSFKSYRSDNLRTDWTQSELETLAIKKEKQVLKAVVQNDCDELKELLDSSHWYKVTDKNCLTLLHIAILQNSKEVFDYLLTIEDFPLEMVSDYGETPLITAILITDLAKDGSMITGTDYYAFELIKRGADIYACDKSSYSTLSCAALKHHVEMAEVLIENGVDLDFQDVCGNTALHHALDHEGPNCVEFVCRLLYHGADARITNCDDVTAFEKSVLHSSNSLLQEILFYYTFDEYSGFKTLSSVLLKLSQYESPLVTQFEDIFIDDGTSSYIQLFYVDFDFLKVLLEKFPSVLKMAVRMCPLNEWSRNAVTFQKVQLFVESDLRDDLIAGIQNIGDHHLFVYLIDSGNDENTILTIFLYLLSYGLNLTSDCLQCLYKHLGFCHVFKTLLFMDIDLRNQYDREVIPYMFLDVTIDLGYYLQNTEKFSSNNVDKLVRFFVHPRIFVLCCGLYGCKFCSQIKDEPQVPLLVELARNVFRKYLIDRFKIENASWFYTMVKNLNISDVYKRIITFEQTLYSY